MSAPVHWTSPFQPTLPARGATAFKFPAANRYGYFNPRSPHGERRSSFKCFPISSISTHAPRTGSDKSARASRSRLCNFNPRSPHGERLSARYQRAIIRRFQPTLPARGATRLQVQRVRAGNISTHAPRTGSDEDVTHWFRRSWRFQPTLPARGATEIRARLAGVRPFQPTLPARGATALGNGLLRRRLGISTHAPRTGSDGADAPCAGGAAISTHAPRTGSDA